MPCPSCRPVIVALILVLQAAAAAAQQSYVVLPDGSGDFPTIQAAIDAAVGGDTVLLGDGVFTGDGNRDLDFAGKAITLRGQAGDARLCVIDCGGSAAAPHRGILFQGGEGPGTVVSHLTIRGGWAGSGGAVLLGVYGAGQSSPTLRACVFTGNTAEYNGGAVWAGWESDPVISDCLFAGNRAERYGGGFGSDFWSQPTLTRCSFVGNVCADPDLSDGGGVYVSATASPVSILGCIVWGNEAALGAQIGSQNHGGIAVDCCDVAGGQAGVHVENVSDLFWGTENLDADPRFCDPDGGVYTLRDDSPCAPGGSDCGRIGAYGVGCLGEITVRPDGSGDFPTIQAAIDAAGPGDTVLLADGTYTGDGNRDLDFAGKAVTLRGQSGDAGLCVIDCGGSAAEHHRGVDFQGGEGPATVLEHVTIRGGWADSGGAIRLGTYALAVSSPTLRSCVFTDNTAESNGGAVWAAWDSHPQVSDCLFAGNRAERFGGGFGSDFWSQPTLMRCTFVGNLCADPDVSDGGGIYVSATASPVPIVDCIAWGNAAALGAQIGSQNHGMIAVDCSDVAGGQAGVHVENVSDLTWGPGNIAADPLFCDQALGDYRLAAASPCLPGNNGCGVRMGCSDQGCAAPSAVPGAGTLAVYLAANRPNPFNPTTRIEFGLGAAGPVTLEIFDLAGRRVCRLVSGEILEAGVHQRDWTGRDDAGRSVASGVYFCRLGAGDFQATRRMMLVR